MQPEAFRQQIAAGRGDVDADLVLKNARVINVFTNEIEEADVAILSGKIVGVGTYSGKHEVNLHKRYVCPGLIDGHMSAVCRARIL